MDNRTLGLIAATCAPALLADTVITGGEYRPAVIGAASMVFMAGWLCSNAAMRHGRAAGTGWRGRAVLLVQAVTLSLAFLFGLVEATGVLGGETLAFKVLDLSWPLSMLWMLVVGVTVVAAKRLAGWRRFVPVLCVPVWLAGMALGTLLLPEPAGLYAGQGTGAVMWILLGLAASGLGSQRAATARPEPAVR